MPTSEEKEKELTEPPLRKWTLMFYFASDNPLAPGIVSQLKAIKNAGYHPEVNVIAHFDPQTEGTPTHIFDVNLINKLKDKNKEGNIGFRGDDPFVRNLLEDKLWVDELDRKKRPIRQRIHDILAKGLDYDPPQPTAFKRGVNSANGEPDKEMSPAESLIAFLDFCRLHYPAEHYMLFILGHGVVVGNDMFLFDEHAEQESLTLKALGHIMTIFRRDIKRHEGQLELISLHSCSMSSAEVAYELGDSARYMLASQGPAFVGSWPYRNILIRILKCVRDGRAMDEREIRWMMTKIFSYCRHNSTDFLLAGYPFDLCLCDLSLTTVRLHKPMKKLSEELIKGLEDPLLKEFILLAHWKSQSFWQESYTDLYDFCFCVRESCADFQERAEKEAPELLDALGKGGLRAALTSLHQACQAVIDALEQEERAEEDRPENEEDDQRPDVGEGRLIVRAECDGPTYQYAHGLSVFFPWSRPSEDSTIMRQYEKYTFAETGWFKFLNAYFEATERLTRKEEENSQLPLSLAAPSMAEEKEEELKPEQLEERVREDMASLLFAGVTVPASDGSLADENRSKPGPSDPAGPGCTCGSIKNFPRDTRLRRQRTQAAPKKPTGFRGDFTTAF